MATNNKDLKGSFPFYGPGPEKADEVQRIQCPVFGFYGGDDARIGATVPKSKELMEKAGKQYEPVTYDGAGHGFMRSGEEPGAKAANKKAREEAWKRLVAQLKKI